MKGPTNRNHHLAGVLLALRAVLAPARLFVLRLQPCPPVAQTLAQEEIHILGVVQKGLAADAVADQHPNNVVTEDVLLLKLGAALIGSGMAIFSTGTTHQCLNKATPLSANVPQMGLDIDPITLQEMPAHAVYQYERSRTADTGTEIK